jgi:hypothetical protein
MSDSARRPKSTPLTLPTVRHPSSLLHLPLVERALSDSTVRYVRRGVDARWSYEGDVATSLTGFNPTTGCVFYRSHSHVARWLGDPGGDTRNYNPSDKLMTEMMFLVHDYLHVVAYQWIAGLRPDLGFGSAPVTKDNYETFVFCHLLTEAVATTGLDYWYLGRIDLDRELGLGTDFTALTVSYHARHEDEYRRFYPQFTAQRASFFPELVKFYCTGEFLHFGKEDLARSPRLIQWLNHELRYGENQRVYTREWLAFLAHDGVDLPRGGAGAPVKVTEPWQKRLAREVGDRLWAMVQLGEAPTDRRTLEPNETWRSSRKRPSDFRFLNWNRMALDLRWGRYPFDPNLDDAFRHWYRQFLVRYPYDKVPKELLALRDELLAKRRVDVCEYLFRGIEPLAPAPEEPLDLFLLG